MLHYPPRPTSGRYDAVAFVAIPICAVPRLAEDHARVSPVTFHPKGSPRGETVRPVVKIELGVTELRVVGAGRRSLTFNDGVHGGDGIGGGEANFNFCPDHDEQSLSIECTVHHPHNIRSAKLELFCRHLAAPVAVKRWGDAFGAGSDIGELVGAEETDGSITKVIAFEDAFTIPDHLVDPGVVADGPLFPHRHLTVARSPYMVKLTVSARAAADDAAELDRYRYPSTAWTYAHALVDTIALSWGRPAVIPQARADVPVATQPFLGRGRGATEAELMARQTALLTAMQVDAPTADKDIVLDASVYSYADYATNPAQERLYYQNMWGDGPLIPLYARTTIKTLNPGSRVAPRSLGRLAFLWDWEDRVDETLAQRLDDWTADAGAPRDQRTTRITRHFLEKTFERLADPRFPKHAFNCPQAHGGKRGDAHPGTAVAKVFPAQPGDVDFPFQVAPTARRTWASWSYAAAGVVDAANNAVDTGVLFSPSCIAGDRYKLSVWVDPGIGVIDQDLSAGEYFDLAADAAELPHAHSGLFTVKRAIKGSYYSSPSFYGGIGATITAIRTRLARELGFESTLSSQPFPNLQAGVNAHLDRIIEQRPVFHTGASGKALILRAVVRAGGVADPDYAFQLVDDVGDHRNAVEAYILNNRISFFAQDANLAGREIHGTVSGARAVVVGFRHTYAGAGHNLTVAVHLNGTPFNGGEAVNALGSGAGPFALAAAGAGAGAGAGAAPLLVAALTINSVLPGAHEPAATAARVTVRCVTHAGVLDAHLDYAGRRATRQLSAVARGALDTFLAQVRALHDNTTPLLIKIIGKQNARGQQRLQYVREYLEARILSRETLCTLFWQATVTALDPGGEVDGGLRRFNRDSISTAWREVFNRALVAHAKGAVENANWATEGRAIFYHLRGRTVLDKKFTTGGIENLFCEEKFGLAGLTVPAIAPADRAEKRWLKAPEVVALHEFGHTLLLTHQLPRHFDTKVANSTTTHHLAHDACIMNYDADTSSFCAYCILRKRGWTLGGLAVGALTGAAWAAKAKELMEADVQADAADVAAKVRLAMFLLRAAHYLADGVDRTAAAVTQMQHAEAAVPVNNDSDRYIWLLRNLVVFFTRIDDDVEKQRVRNALLVASDLPLDRDVSIAHVAASLGTWSDQVL